MQVRGGRAVVFSEGGCGGGGLTTGAVRHACRHRVTAREVFVLGDSFTCSGAAARGGGVWGDYFAVLWRTLSPFVLRVVAGACVGRGSGQPRMPPQERQHEGLGGLGDCFTHSGAASHACRRGSGSTRGFNFLFWGFFCGWIGSRCESMCWPVDRPATHAAAGAAARGVLGFGGFFHTLGSGSTRG